MESEKMNTWKDQQTPALAIVARGDQIAPNNNHSFTVKSQSKSGLIYQIQKHGKGYTCTCEHYQQTQTCIHVIAVKFRIDLQQSNKDIMQNKPTCDYCKSYNVVMNGKRNNKSGIINRYLCKDCGHRFTDNQGFQKKRAEPEKIALALDLYYRGLSIRKVAEHFQQVHNLDISHMTVYRWIEQYSQLASEWMNKQEIHTSERWHFDETKVNVDGKQRWLWNILDSRSRYLLAIHVSENRSIQNTRIPLKKAKQVTKDKPREILTDGMMSYPKAIIKEFGHSGGSRTGYFSPHIRVPSIKARVSNNRIERFHGSEKERIKVMRGFDKDDGCKNIMEGFRVHYNLIRNHQTLGVTPGEMAGLPKIEGFRWLEILKKSVIETPNHL
ncbi:MAG: IS6 family transposase [Candidatus Thermoplasmatota archaeon]